MFQNYIYYTYKIILVNSNNNDIKPKKSVATKIANRIIRIGVILNFLTDLPTPITVWTDSFIKISNCLNKKLPTSYQILQPVLLQEQPQKVS